MMIIVVCTLRLMCVFVVFVVGGFLVGTFMMLGYGGWYCFGWFWACLDLMLLKLDCVGVALWFEFCDSSTKALAKCFALRVGFV